MQKAEPHREHEWEGGPASDPQPAPPAVPPAGPHHLTLTPPWARAAAGRRRRPALRTRPPRRRPTTPAAAGRPPRSGGHGTSGGPPPSSCFEMHANADHLHANADRRTDGRTSTLPARPPPPQPSTLAWSRPARRRPSAAMRAAAASAAADDTPSSSPSCQREGVGRWVRGRAGDRPTQPRGQWSHRLVRLFAGQVWCIGVWMDGVDACISEWMHE